MPLPHLHIRFLSATLGIITLLGVLFWLPNHFFVGFCFFAACVAWWEWLALAKSGRNTQDTHTEFLGHPIVFSNDTKGTVFWIAAFTLGTLFLLGLLFVKTPHWTFPIMLVAMLALFFGLLGVIRKNAASRKGLQASYYLSYLVFLTGGIVYISLVFWFLIEIYQYAGTSNPAWVLLRILLVVWGGDVAGYLVGSMFGTHPLTTRLSPNKTWQGVMGTLMWTTLSFWGFHSGQSHWVVLMGLGLVMGILAVVGDLFESAIKRGLCTKDLGGLIPGHGGVLDRVDAFLFAAPAYFLLLQFGIIN